MGHNYSAAVQQRSYEWLSQYTRKRPAKFSFVCDTAEHRGVWGITMTRDPQISGLPKFDCEIDGQTVRINTSGTPQLEVNPGDGGLGLSGDVTIILNGKQVFQGAVPEKPMRFDIPRRG